MPPSARKPRYERTAAPGMALTPRDVGLIRAVATHRFLRSTHLVALAEGSAQVTLRRLQLLFHHGYLDRPRSQLDWYIRGSEPMVYGLGLKGAAFLKEHADLAPGRVRWSARSRN